MPTIFISYRRDDSSSAAGRLYDRLVERYGKASVFKDVDSIPPGVKFPDYIATSIQASDVALVVIGPHWLDMSTGWGRRRLDDSADFVRVEIETALRVGLPVIPVLVDGASLPAARRLPAPLRPLLEQNGLALRPDPDFTRDMERIFAAVEYWRSPPRRTPAAPTPPVIRADVEPVGPTPVVDVLDHAAPSAVDEQLGTAAQLKQGQRHPRRVATALAAVALIVMVIGLVVLLYDHAGNIGSSSGDIATRETATSSAATSTAYARLSAQPFTGLGPCDTASSHQYNAQSNPYFWKWQPLVTCDNGSAHLEADRGSDDTVMSFYGLPYFGHSGFPPDFTMTATIAFNYTDSAPDVQTTDCAMVSWNMPNESSTDWIDVLHVCQGGTWYLGNLTSGPRTLRSSINVARPFTVKISVKDSKIGVSLNGGQVLSMTPFGGQLDSFSITERNAPPFGTITVSNFVLTPGAA